MPKFPVDAPKSKVVGTLRSLGFQVVREREHISMVRQNADGARSTCLTFPNPPSPVVTQSHLAFGMPGMFLVVDDEDSWQQFDLMAEKLESEGAG